MLDEIRERWAKVIDGPLVAKRFGGKLNIYKGPVKVVGCGMTHCGVICEMVDAEYSYFKAAEIGATARAWAIAPQDIAYLLSVAEAAEEVARAAERLNRAVKLYLKHSNSPVAIGWDEMLDALTEFDKAVAAYRGGVRK